MRLPGINGYQLAEAGTAHRPRLKVLLMTGFAQEPVPEGLAKAGIKVLYKPFDIGMLASWVNRILGESAIGYGAPLARNGRSRPPDSA